MKRSIGMHFSILVFLLLPDRSVFTTRSAGFTLRDTVSHRFLRILRNCGRPNRCCWEITIPVVKFPEVFRSTPTSWDAISHDAGLALVKIASYCTIILYHILLASYLETTFQIVRIPWTHLSKMVSELLVLSLAIDQLFQQTVAGILSMSTGPARRNH